MADADDRLIEALLEDVLDPTMLTDAVDEALHVLQGDASDDRPARLEAELVTVERERARLVSAIAAGGALDGLIQGLQARETRRTALEAERASLRAQEPLRASDAARVRGELIDLAGSWRQVLADDPTHARPIISSLLNGRVTFTPLAAKRWTRRGEGTLRGVFTSEMSPTYGVPNPIHSPPPYG